MTETPVRSDPDLLNSATGAGLLYFFDIMIKRSELTKANGSALRTGSKKVLDTEDDPDNLPLRDLDIEGLLRRFVNRNRVELNDRSLRTYEQRFRQSVEMYLKYIDGDSDWNTVKSRKPGPSRVTKAKSGQKVNKPSEVGEREAAQESNGTAATSTMRSDVAQPGMVTFPIPLRPGVQGKLVLPDDLTEKEAQRVSNIVSALAMAEQLQLTTGAPDVE